MAIINTNSLVFKLYAVKKDLYTKTSIFSLVCDTRSLTGLSSELRATFDIFLNFLDLLSLEPGYASWPEGIGNVQMTNLFQNRRGI